MAGLVGCTPPVPTSSPSPSTITTMPSRSSEPSRSQSREPIPSPDASLPADFPIKGTLAEETERVVAELHRVSGELPALKLDITAGVATLTVLTPEGSVRSYKWRDGVVSHADSDVQYLSQTTFDPFLFPLHDVPRLLDVAALVSGSSNNQVLQIVEFRPGDVYISVTTLPESSTVFFDRDGTAVTTLGGRSVEDISAGLREVTGSTQVVLAVGYSPQTGYWADVPKTGGVVERRTRMGGLPMFAAQRTQTLGITPFDPGLLDPAAIAMSIGSYRTDPDMTCSFEVDNRHDRVQPVVNYDCDGTVHHSDLNGQDMTGQFEG